WPVPALRSRARWAGATFIALPPPAYFVGRSRTNLVVVPGIPPWTRAQPLSRRERCWILEPILRPVLLVGLWNHLQLADRAQLREVSSCLELGCSLLHRDEEPVSPTEGPISRT